MDNKTEVRDFLATRRARITPQQAGLPDFGGHRRVAGLRREEVAMLAGVSVDYYVRLERGNLAGVSESVLEAVCRALQLDDIERMHLFDLARVANASSTTRRKPSSQQIRPTVQRLLDAIDGPAWVRNARTDFLASNQQGRALYSMIFFDPARRPNSARFAFLDPRARGFYLDWEQIADGVVASLRAEAGRNPFDKGLTDLIGELSTRSEEFRVRWAQHDVYRHRAGSKRFHHPVVGDLTLSFEAMELTMDPGLTFLAYSAEPASSSATALQLLASWAATEFVSGDEVPAAIG
ncbi:XRE family transcriptional regulator [Frondihabitans sp. PAMC 28766]|uniref:helix-turn-helix transcriptional regulator n=1 Tax=Frondihabitans sp. PAMC 28766 TaxID=1795630 RepID=UPI00078CC96E|nr:helix-turn-helix transcriptional regulator [Frondihabitans sp. PAMC 28766]AMM18897.1 XRE family transcriptional regulator [Frondihabitans sp. PAMC 28766]